MENDAKTYGEKVDIDELLPRDKQRILTNLYTKLAFGSKWFSLSIFSHILI